VSTSDEYKTFKGMSAVEVYMYVKEESSRFVMHPAVARRAGESKTRVHELRYMR